MKKSIYESELNLKGEITVTLTERERTMICEALAKVSSSESDVVPIIVLCEKIVKGKR